MDTVVPDDAEQLFQQWLSRLINHPELDIDPRNDTTQAWLRQVHRQHGDVTTHWLHQLVFERRWQLAQDLLAVIRNQAEKELGPLPGLMVYVSEKPTYEFPSGLITIEDTGIWGLNRAEAAVEVADGVQFSIIRSRQLIWPECPIHGYDLHPELHQGTPRWICRQGPHSPRDIID